MPKISPATTTKPLTPRAPWEIAWAIQDASKARRQAQVAFMQLQGTNAPSAVVLAHFAEYMQAKCEVEALIRKQGGAKA